MRIVTKKLSSYCIIVILTSNTFWNFFFHKNLNLNSNPWQFFLLPKRKNQFSCKNFLLWERKLTKSVYGRMFRVVCNSVLLTLKFLIQKIKIFLFLSWFSECFTLFFLIHFCFPLLFWQSFPFTFYLCTIFIISFRCTIRNKFVSWVN